jgi:hypothetical protein
MEPCTVGAGEGARTTGSKPRDQPWCAYAIRMSMRTIAPVLVAIGAFAIGAAPCSHARRRRAAPLRRHWRNRHEAISAGAECARFAGEVQMIARTPQTAPALTVVAEPEVEPKRGRPLG